MSCAREGSAGPRRDGPLYRLLIRATGDHVYTASAAERVAAGAQYGYTDEGIACYAYCP